MTLRLILLTTCIWLFTTMEAVAQMPTQAQISQLKAMSPAQQKALAKSVGIDIPSPFEAQQKIQKRREQSDTNQNTADVTNYDQNDADEDVDIEIDETRIAGNQELNLFGRSFFNQGPNRFKHSEFMPVPADYVLGPSDNIIIQFYGKENGLYSLDINREGQIQFPEIGPVNIAGLTFKNAQNIIHNIVNEQMIGVSASVTMGQLRSIRVFVLGEVRTPGTYSIGALSNVTSGLFASGGVTKVGSLRNIELKRNGKTVAVLDLYDVLLKGDTSSDVRLQPGDVIFVPPIGITAEISGQVARPAIYELNKSATAGDLLRMAGGARASAFLADSSLVRINDLGERSFIDLDLSKSTGLRLELVNGDRLKVGKVLNFVHDQIALRGSFKRPGLYSWKAGLRFTDLVSSPFDLMPGSDLDTALIQTMSLQTGKIEALIFSPEKAWQYPKSNFDPEINTYDEIFAFDLNTPREEILSNLLSLLEGQAKFKEQQKHVVISGSVRFPGTYPLAENMTTNQLIDLAGGLAESALGTVGEITRYEISEDLERVVMHLSVDLEGEGTTLLPGDTLRVKQIPLWRQRESVNIQGEVMFPGRYSILPGESLMDVLTRAGGLTPHAYTQGAIFSRSYLRKLEEERLAELKEKLETDMAIASSEEKVGQKAINLAEAGELLDKLDSTKPLGRMVIDLPMILQNPAEHDFQLEDGDVLTIPKFKPSVTVIGEVQYPTSHFFDKRVGAMEYIKRSGGTKKNADRSRIYIVKANGRVTNPSRSAWFRAKKEALAPGDTIVVPLDTERVDSLELWSKATQIMYQAAVGIAAVGNL